MTVFAISDFVSKGARHMFIIGVILLLIGGCVHLATNLSVSLYLLAPGVGLIGGSIAAMAWDFAAYWFQKRQLERAYLSTIKEIQERLKKNSGGTAELKMAVRHAATMIDFRLEELRKHGGNAALIANLEARYKMLTNDIEASTGFKIEARTWMSN